MMPSSMRKLVLRSSPALLLLVAYVFNGCGSSTTATGIVDPTGGEICLPDNSVCINIPPGALDQAVTINIKPTSDVAPAAIGQGYDISAGDSATNAPREVTFIKEAQVKFRIQTYLDQGADSGFDPYILRLFTKEEDQWVPLDTITPPIDMVRGYLVGSTSHLSPFFILRADLLPDGGIPFQIDGGPKDRDRKSVV